MPKKIYLYNAIFGFLTSSIFYFSDVFGKRTSAFIIDILRLFRVEANLFTYALAVNLLVVALAIFVALAEKITLERVEKMFFLYLILAVIGGSLVALAIYLIVAFWAISKLGF
ncbi:MAG: hypothetical protein A3A43_00555 [Candidatus Liptonbacteria bacterium RIFCSPLOWO2_01_FULL_56_20]|uniref:Uncharacterized protein n=1 Tax=Candidatus Liptonbacteria bacterium RIFCSPLOWO2_01_FULL_56_20 TaxID=1798652 RepID=A0A1G2CL21_9BACT|nr:MAG: hypothetical protein A2681_01695 [Candidatus Liptonbacteria bacterium RIFCSPHIGHO2_01_FULL_56_18b]OGZ01118.1 MAG: hypothetical protein A3A43_00555 [Candidatus Liptonbacteria bacterium RIFCSPLOWO2_01_FULL_56_20]